MKEQLTRKKRKSGFKARYIIILLVLLAAAGAVVYALYGDIFQKKDADSQIRFDVYSDNRFAWIDSGLAVASSAGTQLLSAKGEMLSSSSAVMQKPALAAGGNSAAAWSIGSKSFYAISKSGASTVETDGAVINIAMNSEGLIAVAAEEPGYKGAVSVYNTKLKPIYKWSSGEGYVLDTALADSGEKMAAITMADTGSRLSVFSLKSTDQKGSFASDEDTFLDVEYLNTSRICLVSELSAYFLNDKAELISKFDFQNGFIKDYSLDGAGFAVFALGKYKSGGAASVVAISADGKQLGSVNITGEVLSLSASGKYVAVLYNDRLVIYNSNMTEYRSVKDVANIKQVLMRGDGSVVMISNSGALIYRP